MDPPTRDLLGRWSEAGETTREEVTAWLTDLPEAERDELLEGLLARRAIVPTNGAAPHSPQVHASEAKIPLKTLILHVTEACNLRCTYCYQAEAADRRSGRRRAGHVARGGTKGRRVSVRAFGPTRRTRHRLLRWRAAPELRDDPIRGGPGHGEGERGRQEGELCPHNERNRSHRRDRSLSRREEYRRHGKHGRESGGPRSLPATSRTTVPPMRSSCRRSSVCSSGPTADPWSRA